MKERIELTAHFSKNAEGRKIKGFASMNNMDRHDHIIPPEAFDLPRYMNNPQLKYNHKYYKDDNGNQIPIGSVLNAEVAMVMEIGDENYWGILSVEHNAIIDKFEKNASPDCYHGCRGLWVVAEVTVDAVWNRILDGEFNAFSWEGFARFAKVAFGGLTRIVAKYIDLYECSCVFIPDNPSATFVISKSADLQKNMVSADIFANVKPESKLQELHPFQVHFSKIIFGTEKMATEWLIQKGLPKLPLKEENGEFIADVIDMDEKTEATYTMEYATGVQLTMGFTKKAIEEIDSELEMYELTKSLMEDIEMSKETEKQEGTEAEAKVSKAVASVTQVTDTSGSSSPPAKAATPNAGSGDTELPNQDGVVLNNTSNVRDGNGTESTKSTPNTGAGQTPLDATVSNVPLSPPASDSNMIKDAESAEAVEETEAEVTEETVEVETEETVEEVEGAVVEKNADNWTEISQVFKLMKSFDEEVWNTEAPEALKDLAKQFANLVMGEAKLIKSTDALDLIAEKAAEKVVASLREELTTITKNLQSQEEESETEEDTEVAEEGAEVAKSSEDHAEESKGDNTLLVKAMETIDSLSSELKSVKGDMAVMSKSVASPSVAKEREEGTVVTKNAEQDADPNSCFGSNDKWNEAFGVDNL